MKKIKTEIYSRPVGFYRPVQSWNIGKKEEFRERKTFSITKIKDKLNETKDI